MRMRYGRLRLLNAYGSERLALPMVWETQYWNGQMFVRNSLDSCTSLSAANIALSNYQSPPKAAPPLLSASNLGTVTVGAISAGRGTITLTPTQIATGSVDLVVNLGSTGSPSNCASLSNGSSTSAGLAYLSGQWCGAVNDRDPTARASFGVYKTPLIYRRENY
jgi:MSHA biogenesis protein MshQ